MLSRTQASLAISGNGQDWVLLNASPDLRAQLAATPPLHPRPGPRNSPIAAVVVTGAEVDQAAGLLNLRERQPLALYATATTLHSLADNPMFSVLDPEVVSQHPVTLDERFTLPGNIEAELFAVPGKVPLYLEQAGPQGVVENEVNVGIEVAVGTARLTFVPGAAAVTPSLGKRLAEADVVLFDGTVFTDDEMIASGTGTKTGRRMGHMPIDGADGSLARLAGLSRRRIYVHINNTNPILIDGSPERKRVEAAGWEVATDGLEIVL